jgi:C2H2-type zinc finger
MSTSQSRSRKTGSARKRGSSSAGTFVCPECGKTFSTPQGMGAHRNRVHGVAGTSPSAKANKSRRARGKGVSVRSSSKTLARRGARPAASSTRRTGTVDRDQLLSAVFPGGVPAKTSVFEAVARWLDEADRLARLR